MVMYTSRHLTEEAAQRAKKWVEELTHEVQVGETYLGKVTRLMKFGVFVEILPGKRGWFMYPNWRRGV